MYAFDLFKAKFLDDWEESNYKSWGAPQSYFTKQYAKERRKLDRDKAHKNYEISAAFQEAPRPHTIVIPHRGATVKTADNIFAAAMEYAEALEEKVNVHAECIIKLEASVDVHTVLTEATNFEASAVTTEGTNKELKELREIMKQLTASFTA